LTLSDQLQRLITLGVHDLIGVAPERLRDMARTLRGDGVLALHPDLVAAADLAPLMVRAGRPGFVVEDLTDLADFAPTVDLPDSMLYLVHGLDRGDALRNQSPNEADPQVLSAGRTPITVHEGICWLLQQPDLLEPGACFMTTASRRRRADGTFDSRTPAIWISGGSGRDGRERKGAPKVGWCWAGNRHTWLGIASAAGRSGSAPAH
jgi:hypothetical protein